MHPYLLSLCQEYVSLVNAMRQGGYTAEELRTLDSDRQVTHRQLMQLTGLEQHEDMYAHARAIILAARGGNTQ
jgi:hypothetical protein